MFHNGQGGIDPQALKCANQGALFHQVRTRLRCEQTGQSDWQRGEQTFLPQFLSTFLYSADRTHNRKAHEKQ